MNSKPRKNQIYDCAIIGAGPGGLVSALYLRRFRRNIIVINSGQPRASWIPRIRNLIGYNEKISGAELLEKLKEQVEGYQTQFMEGEAIVHRKGKNFEIHVGEKIIHAKKVILATGMRDIHPQIPNPKYFAIRGVLGYCPICDGFDHCDEPIALIVDGTHGFRKIKFITNFSPKMQIIVTKNISIPATYQKLIDKLKLKVRKGSIESLRYSAKPKGLFIKMKNQKEFFVRIAYVALGTNFADTAYKHLKSLKRTKDGFITTTHHQETSIPGLFAVGDCVHALSQVSVAVGHAAIAATHVHNTLGHNN